MNDLERLTQALADRYQIEREIGSGGMATVYLAQDLKHDRRVALKVMRPELSAILGGDRFLGEIRIAAKLNHPHILPLFDSGSADGFLFYVMPFVEGESLRTKLNREKQLPVDEAVSISKQVGAALDHAHQEGVIHRDIKPENILIHQGEALVADFGIALAVSAAGGTRLTDTGLSLGTPEYMSPEQATGERELDARSDLYSLGAMAYEMLVGEPPHTGKTIQAIIAKVVSAEAQPVSRVRHSVPTNVDAAVMCALAKIPADRFGSGAEFGDALTNPAFSLPAGAGIGGTLHREGPWNRLAVLFASIAVVTTLFAIWTSLRPPTETLAPPVHARLSVPEAEMVGYGAGTVIAMSPDGSRFVYIGPGTQLWLRHLDEPHATPINGTEDALAPFFSPDGQFVAFLDGPTDALWTVSTSGSSREMLVEQTGSEAGDWGADGFVYFGAVGGGISRVSTSSGEVEVLTTPDPSRGELEHSTIDLLPNGKGALITIWHGRADDAEIAVVDFDTGAVRVLDLGQHPLYARSGHVVYRQEGSGMVAAPFDQNTMVRKGLPTSLPGAVVGAGSGQREYSLSGTGTFLRIEPHERVRLPVWVDRAGTESVIDPDWTGAFYFPALSPDGTRVAYSANGPEGRHTWIKTLAGGPPSQLTFGESNQPPVWSLDGQRVMYLSTKEGVSGFWEQQVDGTDVARPVPPLETPGQSMGWSEDGSWLVYQLENDIFGYQPDVDSPPVPLVATEFAERNPVLSPDGRWLAYDSNRSGQYEVYVKPFPDVDDAVGWKVSNEGGFKPLWAHNGHELFYVNGDNELVAAEYETEPSFRSLGENFLFSVDGFYITDVINQAYAVDGDDSRFLLLKNIYEPGRRLVLTINFFTELEERVGQGG